VAEARRLALGVIVAIILSVEAGAADWSGPWTQLASDGTLSVRIAVAAGTTCPKATADEIDLPIMPRASADDGFPVNSLSGIRRLRSWPQRCGGSS